MRSTQMHSPPSWPAGGASQQLFRRWQQDKDVGARDELVKRYLPLARKLARRYTGAHEPFEDLFQVASFGLLKALDRFDPEHGTAFSSFAVPTIVGELKRYFRDLGWSAHVPRGAQELALKVQRVQQRLTTSTGRSPTVQELAQYMELSIEDVLAGIEAAGAHHATSLEVPREDGEDDDGTLADTLGVEDAGFELVEDSVSVAAAMRLLSDRERHILMLRFLEDRTQSEIAEVIGVSQMQISRLLRRAIARLTELSESETAEAGDEPPTQSRPAPRHSPSVGRSGGPSNLHSVLLEDRQRNRRAAR
jgi:RNA polymerase sigma-B factor